VDADYQFALWPSEQRVSNLAKYFGVMAIILCLCLAIWFWTALFHRRKAKKEIGDIARIMGASNYGYLTLVSKDFG